MRLAPLQVSGIEVRWHRHKPKKSPSGMKPFGPLDYRSMLPA